METAIVFDLDGVLVDTEPLKARAHRAALEARGGSLDEELYRREMGNPHAEVVRAFLAASGLEAHGRAVRAYEETFRSVYRRLLADELEPAEGAVELLAACRREGRPRALVTSSDPWMVDIVLERLGAEDAFGAVVTAADVSSEKPDPAPYLRARSALGAAAGAAVALEDTRAGVASAAGADLPVIAVRHRFNRDRDLARADAVVASLAPPEDVLALADRLGRGRPPDGAVR